MDESCVSTRSVKNGSNTRNIRQEIRHDKGFNNFVLFFFRFLNRPLVGSQGTTLLQYTQVFRCGAARGQHCKSSFVKSHHRTGCLVST
jgi:hypothetical protein